MLTVTCTDGHVPGMFQTLQIKIIIVEAMTVAFEQLENVWRCQSVLVFTTVCRLTVVDHRCRLRSLLVMPGCVGNNFLT